MLDRLTKDLSISLLSKSLDGAEARHKALADNIANANTPGYKRSDVPFQEMLRHAVSGRATMVTTHVNHLPGRSGVSRLAFEPIKVADSSRIRVDGNNVDIEAEMAKLAENSLMYSVLSDLLSRRISLLRSVINEGRR